MKFNWGYGIAIVFSLFVTGMLYMVFKSTQYPADMVKQDYYQDDLSSGERWQKEKNYKDLKFNGVEIKKDKERLTFIFSSELKSVDGVITFYRPSDKKLDFFKEILLDAENSISFQRKDLALGSWEVQLDWVANGKPYYYSENIFL